MGQFDTRFERWPFSSDFSLHDLSRGRRAGGVPEMASASAGRSRVVVPVFGG